MLECEMLEDIVVLENDVSVAFARQSWTTLSLEEVPGIRERCQSQHRRVSGGTVALSRHWSSVVAQAETSFATHVATAAASKTSCYP